MTNFANTVYHRVTNDTETLAEVLVLLNMEPANFQPQMAVIATWFFETNGRLQVIYVS